MSAYSHFLKTACDARLIAGAVENAVGAAQEGLEDLASRSLRDAYSLPIGDGNNCLTYRECFRRVVGVVAVEGLRRRGFKPVGARNYARRYLNQVGGGIRVIDLLRWRKWLLACEDPAILRWRDRLAEIYSTDTHLFAIAILIAFAPAF
ncbi:hypothetical protein [Ensifer canadensis]|uniref:hypothetical protein n=1 Tax=Ensifer canadensis TaxID=555315 RepID=UPI0035E3E325